MYQQRLAGWRVNSIFCLVIAKITTLDDHDILEFSTYSLFTDAAQLEHAKQQLAQEERAKAQAEFERQQKEYELERQKYKEKHPEKAKDDEDEAAKYYEDPQMRELRNIYETQANIHRLMQEMDTKLQEIAKQQQMHTSLLQGTGVVQQQQQQAAAGGSRSAFQIFQKIYL